MGLEIITDELITKRNVFGLKAFMSMLVLTPPTPQNGQTHSNDSSRKCPKFSN